MKANFLRSASCWLALTVAAVALVALLPCAALAQQKLGAPPGKGSFTRYCASCHGVDGKGNGPMASLLTTKPNDLTQLAKKNNGKFPALRVARIIDGREPIAAHGPVDMPVYGERFGLVEAPTGGSPVEQTTIRQRIQLLVQYINHIQEK